MACSCSNKNNPKGFTVTAPDGYTATFRTEVEAAAVAKRKGGSYTPAV